MIDVGMYKDANSYIKGADNYALCTSAFVSHTNGRATAHIQWHNIAMHILGVAQYNLAWNIDVLGGRKILGLAWSHGSSKWAIEIHNHYGLCLKSYTGFAIMIPHLELEYTWHVHLLLLSFWIRTIQTQLYQRLFQGRSSATKLHGTTESHELLITDMSPS